MSKKTFQQYGELANEVLSHSVAAGRYRIHSLNEPYLIQDIISKLDLQPTDRLLEIGCGPGNLLIPLSFMVGRATGIDHPNVVKRFNKRFSDEGLTLIGANFLDYSPEADEQYEKILINSVLPALCDEKEAIEFVDRAAQLLVPGGKMLIGDIANIDKKQRFVETEFGQAFSEEWQNLLNEADGAVEERDAATTLKIDDEMLVPTDDFILNLVRLYRRTGWEAYCLPQPTNLPFGYTREDILIIHLPK